MKIYETTRRAKVLVPTTHSQLKEYIQKMVPLPALFDLFLSLQTKKKEKITL